MRPLAYAAVLAAACLPPDPELAPAPVFRGVASAAEYAPYREAGSATITGRVSLDPGRPAVSRPAGIRIVLDPATSFAQRWYSEIGLVPGQFDAIPSDTTFGRVRQTAITDSTGSFAFHNLPAGRYIVATLESWEIPDGRNGLRTQSGVSSHLVTLVAGQRVQIEFGEHRQASPRP